jgi:hypothetical protein
LRVCACSPEGIIGSAEKRMEEHDDEEIWYVLAETSILGVGVVLRG